MSFLYKCVNARQRLKTPIDRLFVFPFLNLTWGLFRFSHAAFIQSSCCCSTEQEESIMWDLHFGLSSSACLKKKKRKKKISCGAGCKSAPLPLSAVKWHKSLSSSSEAIKPQEPVKLQPSRPCLIKPTAIKTKTGLIPTLRVSSVSRRMDTSHIKMSLWVFSDVNTRMGIHFLGLTTRNQSTGAQARRHFQCKHRVFLRASHKAS